MSQRNLLATFKDIHRAKQAEQALQQAGFHELQVDYISPYPGDGIEERTNPITGNISSLADYTLGADVTSRSAGILNAVDNSASGMADGYNLDQGNEEGLQRNVLLTVVTNISKAKQAEKVIREYGGEI